MYVQARHGRRAGCCVAPHLHLGAGIAGCTECPSCSAWPCVQLFRHLRFRQLRELTRQLRAQTRGGSNRAGRSQRTMRGRNLQFQPKQARDLQPSWRRFPLALENGWGLLRRPLPGRLNPGVNVTVLFSEGEQEDRHARDHKAREVYRT